MGTWEATVIKRTEILGNYIRDYSYITRRQIYKLTGLSHEITTAMKRGAGFRKKMQGN
jgi:hypothetical protein